MANSRYILNQTKLRNGIFEYENEIPLNQNQFKRDPSFRNTADLISNSSVIQRKNSKFCFGSFTAVLYTKLAKADEL